MEEISIIFFVRQNLSTVVNEPAVIWHDDMLKKTKSEEMHDRMTEMIRGS